MRATAVALTEHCSPLTHHRPGILVPFVVFYPFIYMYAVSNNAFTFNGSDEEAKDGGKSSGNKLIIR